MLQLVLSFLRPIGLSPKEIPPICIQFNESRDRPLSARVLPTSVALLPADRHRGIGAMKDAMSRFCIIESAFDPEEAGLGQLSRRIFRDGRAHARARTRLSPIRACARALNFSARAR